jgi:hypothetical protein
MTPSEEKLARDEIELATLNALDARDLDIAEASGKPETERRGMTQDELDSEEREFLEHARLIASGRAATDELLTLGRRRGAQSIPYPRVVRS